MTMWAAVLAVLVTVSHGADTTYKYTEQATWGGKCQDGLQQSPIDVSTIHDTVYYKSGFPTLPDRQLLTFYHQAKMTISYSVTGNPIVKMPPSWPVGSVVGLKLLNVHLHWGASGADGSEHLLFGERYQGEIHIVTRNLDQNNIEADDYYSVLGALLKEDNSVAAESKASLVLKELVMTDPVEGDNVNINLNDLYSMDHHSIYTYEGSLTTPDCDEHVFWHLFEKPLMVKPAVMNKLRGYKGIGATFRDTQPLHNRVITHRLLEEKFNSPPRGAVSMKSMTDPDADLCVWDCSVQTYKCFYGLSGAGRAVAAAHLTILLSLLFFFLA